MIKTPENINIFLAYSKEDKPYLDELRTQLNVLERIGLVDKIWYDGLIEVGANWEESIKTAMNKADIVIVLVSADFIASDFCYQEEMQRALELEKQGQVEVVPVIVRQCLWDSSPFGKLKVLPTGGFPVASNHWNTKEEPYVQVVEEIEKIILAAKSAGKATNLSEEQTRSTYTSRIEEGDNWFAKSEFAKAKAQYQEALSLFQPGYQPPLHSINTKIDQCQNEIFFKRNFEKGEKAYLAGDYKAALPFFNQALVFKPNDGESNKLLRACQKGLGITVAPPFNKESEEKEKKKGGFFQFKIFGIEIFKIIVALAVLGVSYPLVTTIIGSKQQDIMADIDIEAADDHSENTKVIIKEDDNNIVVDLPTDIIEVQEPSPSNIIPVKNTQEKWAYIGFNKKGEKIELTEYKYDKVWRHTTEGLAYVQKQTADGQKQCGFIDTKGKEVIPLTYLDAASFEHGRAMVKVKEGLYAFIDTNNKVKASDLKKVITKTYDDDQQAVVERMVSGKSKRQIIDLNGQCIHGGCLTNSDYNAMTKTEKMAYYKKEFEEARRNYKDKKILKARVILSEIKNIGDFYREYEAGNLLDIINREYPETTTLDANPVLPSVDLKDIKIGPEVKWVPDAPVQFDPKISPEIIRSIQSKSYYDNFKNMGNLMRKAVLYDITTSNSAHEGKKVNCENCSDLKGVDNKAYSACMTMARQIKAVTSIKDKDQFKTKGLLLKSYFMNSHNRHHYNNSIDKAKQMEEKLDYIFRSTYESLK